MTREEVFELAEARFTSAISHAQAADRDDLRLMAVAGRARARLNLGNLSGAASDAEQIPEGFVWNAEYSTADAQRENRIYNINLLNRFASADPETYAGLEIGGEADPRVRISDSGLPGRDNATRHWYQERYGSAADPIPMASWAKAQLILAERRRQLFLQGHRLNNPNIPS